MSRRTTQLLYCEDGLSVRNQEVYKSETGTRAKLLTAAAQSVLWLVDLVPDQLAPDRQFRTVNKIDDVKKECLTAVFETSI